MPVKSISEKGQQAPCGQVVDLKQYEEWDEECLIIRKTDYSCGCHRIRHEYHDGSVSRKVVRHDGTVLVDELLAAE